MTYAWGLTVASNGAHANFLKDNLYHDNKTADICIFGVPEGDTEEAFWGKMSEDLPHWVEIGSQDIQEAKLIIN